MEFIISDIVTFNKKYAKDNHKYLELTSLEDLEGFPRIIVRIHELDALSVEQENLQSQIEALAFFGYVNLVYVDEEGNENTHYKRIENPIIKNTQLSQPSFEEAPITEEYIQSVLDNEEGGCAGGACTL